MPPKNKPQLTAEEIGLVQAWIHAGGHFTVPLAALPPTDTIHQLATRISKAAPPAERFDFPPPDAGLVKEPNTASRVIRSEKHRLGQACVSTCISRCSTYHEKK